MFQQELEHLPTEEMSDEQLNYFNQYYEESEEENNKIKNKNKNTNKNNDNNNNDSENNNNALRENNNNSTNNPTNKMPLNLLEPTTTTPLKPTLTKKSTPKEQLKIKKPCGICGVKPTMTAPLSKNTPFNPQRCKDCLEKPINFCRDCQQPMGDEIKYDKLCRVCVEQRESFQNHPEEVKTDLYRTLLRNHKIAKAQLERGQLTTPTLLIGKDPTNSKINQSREPANPLQEFDPNVDLHSLALSAIKQASCYQHLLKKHEEQSTALKQIQSQLKSENQKPKRKKYQKRNNLQQPPLDLENLLKKKRAEAENNNTPTKRPRLENNEIEIQDIEIPETNDSENEIEERPYTQDEMMHNYIDEILCSQTTEAKEIRIQLLNQLKDKIERDKRIEMMKEKARKSHSEYNNNTNNNNNNDNNTGTNP